MRSTTSTQFTQSQPARGARNRRRATMQIVVTAMMLCALLLPAPLFAQLEPVEPPFPCPADRSGMTFPCPMPPWVEPPVTVQPVTVESFTVDALVDGAIATVTITEVLRNDSGRVAEGVYLFPLPKDATASSLALEIDGEIVEGELYAAGEGRARSMKRSSATCATRRCWNGSTRGSSRSASSRFPPERHARFS